MKASMLSRLSLRDHQRRIRNRARKERHMQRRSGLVKALL